MTNEELRDKLVPWLQRWHGPARYEGASEELQELHSIARDAYNAGLEAAAVECENAVDEWSNPSWRVMMARRIRALKLREGDDANG